MAIAKGVFISDDSLNNRIRARQFEINGQWEQAKVLRKFEGQDDDVRAIDLIIDANSRGDDYRRLSSPIFEDFEARMINIYELHDLLTVAHTKVYGRPY